MCLHLLICHVFLLFSRYNIELSTSYCYFLTASSSEQGQVHEADEFISDIGEVVVVVVQSQLRQQLL